MLGGYRQATDLVGRDAVKKVLFSLLGYEEVIDLFKDLANSSRSEKNLFVNFVDIFDYLRV